MTTFKINPLNLHHARNVLRREWRTLRRRASNVTTGLDLDGDCLRIAQVRRVKDGLPVLLRVHTLSLHRDNEEDVNPDLLALVRDWRLEQSRIVTFLPREATTVKRLTLPTCDPEELRRIASYEACRFLPRAPEEILADIEIIQTHDDGSCDAWLYAVLQSQVGELIDVLDRLGLEPDVIETSVTALGRLIQGNGETADAFCFVGEKRVDLLIKQAGATIFSRGLNRATLGDSPELLCQELARSIQFAQRSEGIGPMAPIALLGPSETFEELLHAQGNDSIFTAAQLPPQVMNTDAVEEPLDPYSAAIGAALSDGHEINLYPHILVERRGQRRRLRVIALTALLGIAALLLAVANGDRYLASEVKYLDEQRRVLRDLSSQAKDLRHLEQRIQTISQHLSSQSDPVDLYAEMFRVVPEGIAINQMELARGKLMLKGQAKAFGDIWELVDELNKSPLLKGSRVQFASSRTVKGSLIIDFSVESNVKAVESSAKAMEGVAS